MFDKINKFLELYINKIVILFLFFGPILDITTSLFNHLTNYQFNFAIVIKLIFMILLVFYYLYNNKSKVKFYYFITIFIYIFIFSIVVLTQKGTSGFLYEIQNLTRNFFFPICLLTISYLYKTKKINLPTNFIVKILGMYLVLLILPIITNTGFDSYTQGKTGTIGWFYSTNEISGIISIMLPFLVLFIIKLKNKIFKLLISICIMYIYFKIGTKVPILSALITIILFLLMYLTNIFRNKQINKILGIIVATIVVIIGIVVFIPKTSFYKNIIIHLEFLNIDRIEDLNDIKIIDHFIFSERITFLENTFQNYKTSSTFEKIVGIGYIENSGKDNVNIKTIEMDYYDILFRYGILGFVLFFIPLKLILIKIIKSILKLNILTFDHMVFIASILLILLLSLFSGHILTAPSVSILVVIILNEANVIFKKEELK
ncbi:MAG: O-antigen ligase family protein [Bacilli bacterium]